MVVDPTDDIVVLHVDDEPDFAELTGTFLQRLNERFKPIASRGVDDALATLERERVDCVVTDYDMPGRNGIEFLQLIRERYGDLPVVLFTGRGSEEIASEAISAGVSDYLRKQGGTDQYALLANRIESLVSRSRAEKQLLDHLNRMNDAFFSLDERSRFTYLNGRAERLLRRDRTELIGRSIWEAFPNTVGTELEAEYRRTMTTGEPTTLEYYHPPLDVDFEVHAYPSDNGLSVYFRDISERRRRERAVRDLSERLELALDGAEIGVWDWNIETDEVTFDERYASMLGYGVRELEPRFPTWEALAHPEDKEPALEALEAHLAGETEQYQFDHRMRTKDDNWKWIRDRGRVVERGSDGEPKRAVGIHIDITDQKQRERALERTTARLEALFERSPDMIDVHDGEGTIVDANGSLCEALGYSADELIGLSVWDIDPEIEPDEARALWKDIDVGETRRIETNFIRHDDTTFPVEVHLRRIGSRGDDQFLASSRDISAQKAYERHIERENARLEEFTSVVSHDLRNPLNVLAGYLELARETGDTSHFERCERAVSDMQRLIDDLLTLAKQGERVGDTVAVSLADHLDRCQLGVEYEGMTVHNLASGTLAADPGRLTQLLENLLHNAAEHGGPRVTVTVGDLPDGFYVEDDGPGIEATAREQVFTNGYTTSESGTGFGLPIVQHIADAHGWDLTLAESDGGGARFEFTGVTRAS